MALLLAPGFMTDADLWRDMLGELEDFGPIFHADLSRDGSIEAMAHRALADAPPSFVAIGFSMGGYVVHEMARIAPDRTLGLVLIATSARADSAEQQRRKAHSADAIQDAAFGGLSRKAITLALHPDRQDDGTLIDRVQAMAARLGGEVFQRQSRLERHGNLAQLASIQCPTLILAGEGDRLRSMAEAEELQAGIPGSELVVIEQVGHMIPMETPRRAAVCVKAWMQAHVPMMRTDLSARSDQKGNRS